MQEIIIDTKLIKNGSYCRMNCLKMILVKCLVIHQTPITIYVSIRNLLIKTIKSGVFDRKIYF